MNEYPEKLQLYCEYCREKTPHKLLQFAYYCTECNGEGGLIPVEQILLKNQKGDK